MPYVSKATHQELKNELKETENQLEAAADQDDIRLVEYYNEQHRYLKAKIQLIEIYL